MREFITEHTTAAGPGNYTVMYADEESTAEVQQGLLQAFWSDIYEQCVSAGSFRIPSGGKIVDPVDGSVANYWSGDPTSTTPGSIAGAPMADANQALIRWRTSTVVNNRRLAGRTFIPNLSSSGTSAGNLLPALQDYFQTVADAFIASGFGLLVWHRPGTLGPGSVGIVNDSSVWAEMAVLRNRRR